MKYSALCILVLQVALPVASAQLPPMREIGSEGAIRRPRLFVAQPVFDLGTIIEGDKLIASWTLVNRGDSDLLIDKTKTPCGCTVVKLSEADKIIPPQGELKLLAEFDSKGRKGPQRKSVMVYSNDPLEPMMKLELTAQVQSLYTLTPASRLNLRALQRNRPAKQTLDLTPADGGAPVALVSIEFPPNVPLSYKVEPFDAGVVPGQRIRFTVDDNAPLGTVKGNITLRIKVGEVEKTRTMPIRAEIIGELAYQPKVVNAIRQKTRPGRKLAPVDIMSTSNTPFDLLAASAGPMLDVAFGEVKRTHERTVYRVVMTVRNDVPTGPFAALLKVHTTSLDQPVLRVPVYGYVADPVYVDPPLVRLRQDGTAVGAERRVRIEAAPQDTLKISNVVCANEAVTVAIDEEAGKGDEHIAYLDVALVRPLAKGTHDTSIIFNTNISGAERIEIPVSIDVVDPE